MTTFLIVQHAEKLPESIDGDPGLTERGREQAAAAAARLAAQLAEQWGEPAAVYTSPLRRARETAAALPWPATVDERLRERMNWTPDCGLSFDEFLAEWSRASADRDYVPPVGESSRSASARLAAALSDLAHRHPGDATIVVLVSHGGVTLDLLRDLRGTDEGLPLETGIEPCAVTRVEWPVPAGEAGGGSLPEGDVDAGEFDRVFAEAAASEQLPALMRLGFPDLPEWVQTYNFVPASGLDAMADLLGLGSGSGSGLGPGSVLLDLCCGLGGPGHYLARRTGAAVVGVDWSRVGASSAAATAGHLGIAASYVAASGGALPLAAQSVDAAVCIDALRFLPDFGIGELLRVLKPGAPVGITAWEGPDFAALLGERGFDVLHVEHRPEWIDRQREVYRAARRMQAEGRADPAVARLAGEADEVLPMLDGMRRVLLVARAPGGRS